MVCVSLVAVVGVGLKDFIAGRASWLMVFTAVLEGKTLLNYGLLCQSCDAEGSVQDVI